jgi:hypothetical protein
MLGQIMFFKEMSLGGQDMAALATKLVWLESPLHASSSPLQMPSLVMERPVVIAHTKRLLVTGSFFLGNLFHRLNC